VQEPARQLPEAASPATSNSTIRAALANLDLGTAGLASAWDRSLEASGCPAVAGDRPADGLVGLRIALGVSVSSCSCRCRHRWAGAPA